MHCLVAGRFSIIVACVCMCMHIEVLRIIKAETTSDWPNALHPLVSLEAARLLPDSVTYHQTLPHPNNPYQAMIYASWTGFSLRITDEYSLRSSWEVTDTEARGCFVFCIQFRSGRPRFCTTADPIVNFGKGRIAAKCNPGDMSLKASASGVYESTLLVSGSLSGSVDKYKNDGRLGIRPFNCLGKCGFVYKISVKYNVVSIMSLDLLMSSDDAFPAMSHVGTLSPGPSDGFWVGGIVEEGSGSFQTGPNFELSSNTNEMSPRGFIGYFSYGGTSHLELMWAQQLGDDRLSTQSPAIGAIADSTSCSAVVAGAWEGGSQIFEAPEAVNSVTAPEVFYNATEALDAASSVAAVVITLPGGCASSEGPASASVHGITTGGDVVAVSAGQAGVNANVYVAVEGGGDGEDGTPVIYEATLRADGGNGAMVWEQGSSALDLSVPDLEGVAGLVYDSKSDNLFLYMQRRNSVCSFGVLSFGNLSTTWRDAYGLGCGCTAGKMGLQITHFNEYLTERDTTNLLADISAHGQNKVLCFSLTGTLASPQYCAAPGQGQDNLIWDPVQPDFTNYYTDGRLIPQTISATQASIAIDYLMAEAPANATEAEELAAQILDLIRNTVLSDSPLSKTIDAMEKILDLAQTAGSGVQLTEQTKGNILTATSFVSHRFEGTDAVKDRAKALQDRLFLSAVQELRPGETIALDAQEVQFVGARSSPGNVIKALQTVTVTARWIIPEDLHDQDLLLLLEHWHDPPKQLDAAAAAVTDVSGRVTMRALDPITLQQVSREPSDASLGIFEIPRQNRGAANQDDKHAAADCAYVDADSPIGMSTPDGAWRSNGCISKPGLVPRGTAVVWNLNFRIPEKRPAPEPMWYLVPLDETYEDFECRTVLRWPSPLIKRDEELGLVFDDITFEGPDCWWHIPDPFGKWPKQGRGQSCRWDDLAQAFAGPECVVPALDRLGCMCNHWPVFAKVSMLPLPESIQTFNETVVQGEEREPSEPLWLYFLVVVLTVFSCLLLICYFNHWRKRQLLARLLQERYGFQGHVERKSKRSNRRGFDLKNYLDMTWRWSLDTHEFEVLADDMDAFSSLSARDKSATDFFCSTVSWLLSAVGMPFGRAIVALPRAESLHTWMPHNIIGTSNMEAWRNQALGTSMMMAFFIKHNILPRDILKQQLERQELYFAGCHPIGFEALIRRWRVMLFRNNIAGCEFWYKQAHSWRLVWLQRHDALWDPSSCFLKALGADPDPLIAKVHCSEFLPGLQILVDQMPSLLVRLFMDEKKLGLRLWCTFLATAYLESSDFLWSDFTGREGDDQDEPTLLTVIARDAIGYQINSRITEEFFAHVDVTSTEELLASIEETAKQVVTSFINTRRMRIKGWIIEDLAMIEQKDITKIEKLRKKDLAKCVKRMRHEHHSFQRLQMARRGREMDPSSRIVGVINVFIGMTSKRIYWLFHVHKGLRMFCSSIADGLSLLDRVLIVWTTIFALFGMNIWIVQKRGGECCVELRELMECPIDSNKNLLTENCTRVLRYSYTSPAKIRYTHSETQFVPSDTPCAWLANNFIPEEWHCKAFPDPLHLGDIILAGLICNAIALPFRILLRYLFTYKNSSLTSLWDTRDIMELIRDHLPCASLRRKGTGEEGWNVRTAETIAQRAQLQPVEDHFALEKSSIKDLDVTDHVVCEEPPSPLSRAVKRAAKSARDCFNLSSEAARSRHENDGESPADHEMVGSSSSIPHGGEESSSGSGQNEQPYVADGAHPGAGSLYLPGTQRFGQKYVRPSSSQASSTSTAIIKGRQSARVISFANGGVMFRPPEPPSSPDVQSPDAQEQPEGSSGPPETTEGQHESTVSPATQGLHTVSSMPKKRRGHSLRTRKLDAQQQQRKRGEGTEDGAKPKTVRLPPPPPEGKCPHFFCI